MAEGELGLMEKYNVIKLIIKVIGNKATFIKEHKMCCCSLNGNEIELLLEPPR